MIFSLLVHSWFRLVINILIASMYIGFHVTISKFEVQMTSKLFLLVAGLKYINGGFKLVSGCVSGCGPILTLEKREKNHQNLIFKTLVIHPGTPFRNELRTCDSNLQNSNICTNIYHKINRSPNGPLIFRILKF